MLHIRHMLHKRLASNTSQRKVILKTTTLGVLLFLLILIQPCEAQEWKGLQVLHSTREDAERLLGKPLKGRIKGFGRYETKEERVDIWYAHGRCRQTDELVYRVPVNTITKIHLDLRKKMPISFMKEEIKNYTKWEQPFNTSIFSYLSKDETKLIEIFVDKFGQEDIIAIEYLPSIKNKKLLCNASVPGVKNDYFQTSQD